MVVIKTLWGPEGGVGAAGKARKTAENLRIHAYRSLARLQGDLRHLTRVLNLA